MPKSLLFIPDITGFTHFVNNTEIEHSQHIISELLEIIIDGNELGMEVSEVEGDAVLFYKTDKVPELDQVYGQARQMFLAFHSHLKLYESRRICQCGACSSASKLSLKFIAHCGEIGFTTIKNTRKPFGSDLVLLHRLCKNDVKHGEYILFTHQFIDENKDKIAHVSHLNFKDGVNEYESIGLVNYKYLPFSDLHAEVPEPPAMTLPEKMKDPITHEYIFDLSPLEAYEYLSNFELKKMWSEGIQDFEYEPGKVNRIGTKHICIFEKGRADVESVTNDFGEKNVVYGERFTNFPLARGFTVYFILEPFEDKTKIRTEVHFKPLPVVGWLLKPIISMNVKKINKNFISSFSKLKKIQNLEMSETLN